MIEPLETIDLDNYEVPVLPTCSECGNNIITVYHWKQAGERERQEMLEDDFVRESKYRLGMCVPCSNATTEQNKIDRAVRAQAEVDRFKELRAEGREIRDIAVIMDIPVRSLTRRMGRARKRGAL